MKIELDAKNKLRFVEGKIAVPKEGSQDSDQWRRCDYMVMSWILNSISKELVGSFLYVINIRELWIELGERYSESNELMIYQIKQKITSISQENLSVTAYYSQLKQLWDELANIKPVPPCNCRSEKLATEIHNTDHLMQFLMGLNDVFNQVCNQILLLDPLLTANKAFLMVLRVESQKKVQTNIFEYIKKQLQQSKCHVTKENIKCTTDKKVIMIIAIQMDIREPVVSKLIGYLEWFKNKHRNFTNLGPSKFRYTAHISHADGHNVGIYGITAG